MKVIHILKRMETIDSDIKDLRKMEKALTKNKSFTTPIYMSIEKQINIKLSTRYLCKCEKINKNRAYK